MLILLKSGPYGPMYINPESIASVREIPVGMRENRGEVEITMISGLRDFITLEEWEHIKPGLMGDASHIAEADLKLIAEAWDSVDSASPISILFADPAQVEVLLNLAKAVEAFLFPKGK